MTAAIKSNAASFRAAAGILCWLCVCMILYSHASAAGDRKYIGSETCADCHPAEYDSWRGSHHDLAMQPANSETVLGDFDNTEFNHFGVTSTFYREGDRFLVRTDGADGSLQDFEISYTFGVHPLQQYLVEIPGGRMQALSIAWDSRSAAAGGQRWFHLYGDEAIRHDDILHWTQPSQNWNNMCAECHSTRHQMVRSKRRLRSLSRPRRRSPGLGKTWHRLATTGSQSRAGRVAGRAPRRALANRCGREHCQA